MEKKSRYQLVIVVCLLLLVGFLANSISGYYVSRDNVRRTITESALPLTSDNIYSVIQRDLLQPIFISSMMANDAFLREWTIAGEEDPRLIERYLSEIRREYGTVTSFFVSEFTRNYYYFGGLLKQVREDEPRDAWYFRVREMEEPFEINVDPDLANRDAMTIFINYRVYDFDGNYIGATGTGLTVNRVNQLIQEYQERFDREIFFVDREGKIMLSPDGTWLSEYRNIAEIPGLKRFAADLLIEAREKITYRKDGDTYFLNSRFVPELDWFLMVEQKDDVLLAPLREALFRSLAVALLITALVAGLCISLIRRDHRRLEAHNAELARINVELERTSAELQKANKSLDGMNREKDDFLGIVAHDLRTPLNGILGFAEEIQRELPRDQVKLHEYLEDIRNAGYDMLELISDVLNLSTIESFKGEMQRQPCAWNQLVRDAHRRFRMDARRKLIDLNLELDAAAEVEVASRDKWIAICINNLLSNAIKYSPVKSVVTIETRRCGDMVEIRVLDEGPGLTEEEIGTVFDKFSKVKKSPTAGEHSTGFGLYVVKKICRMLGAEIRVESVPGEGSSFILRHAVSQH